MVLVRRLIVGVAQDVRGFTALEYTLITVVLGVVILAGVDLIGNSLSFSFDNINTLLAQHAATA